MLIVSSCTSLKTAHVIFIYLFI